MNILISACLLGQFCRYDGKIKHYSQVEKLMECQDVHFIPICPEQMGGLATPREASERCDEGVVSHSGRDVTKEYQRGAQVALYYAQLFHCPVAVLKEKSPSCGHGKIYDGTFTRTLKKGDGVTAELLKKHGIKIIGESEL